MTGSVQLQSYQAPNTGEVSPLISQPGQQAGDGRSLFAKAAAGLGGALVKACRAAVKIGTAVILDAFALTGTMYALPFMLPYSAALQAGKYGIGEKRMQQLASGIKATSGSLLWPVLKALHRGLSLTEARLQPMPRTTALIR